MSEARDEQLRKHFFLRLVLLFIPPLFPLRTSVKALNLKRSTWLSVGAAKKAREWEPVLESRNGRSQPFVLTWRKRRRPFRLA